MILAGCDRAPAAEAVSVRDSAGVTIVVNRARAAAPRWTLGEATVSLGAMDEGEAYELYQPLHALRLDDGRIVVANQGTEELRFYGPDGRHLRTVGRSGGGPGEFQEMWGMVPLRGDSLGVWDWTADRLSIYDDDGTFARLVTPTADVGGFAPRLIGAFDSTFVILRGFNPAGIFMSGGGVRQDSILLLRLALDDGALVDSLGPYPGAVRYVAMSEAGGFWMRGIKFGRGEHVVVGAGQVFVGDDRTGEIRGYAPGGHLLRIVRLPHEARAVTAEHLARHDEAYLADIPEDRLAEERRRLEETPAADALPAFDDLFVDALGRLWIEMFDLERDRPATWTILDADGRSLARIELPPRARPLDAGEDYVLLFHRDELDIEHITLHPLLEAGKS